jgi:hypothetical protein
VSSKYAIIVIVVMAAIILSGFVRDPAQAVDTYEVQSVTFSPDPVVAGQPMSFEVELTDDTDVSSVIVSICTEISCFPPLILDQGTDDVWRGTTDLIDEPATYHFEVIVNFDNGTSDDTAYIYFTAVSQELELKSLKQAPENVILDTEVDVYAELNTTEFVDQVLLYHCQGDVCFQPLTMTKLANGTYHARFGPFDTEEVVKYNVTTLFKDGERSWTSWTANVTFTPAAKTSNGDDDDDNGGIIPAMGAVAALAIITGLAVSRRGRKGKEQ